MFAVVVVTFSAPAETLDATLRSVAGSMAHSVDTDGVGDRCTIIVVDTGGAAVVDEATLQSAGEVTIELHPMQNRGYGAAANVGFARAAELGAARVALLNDDVIVRPGWLGALANELGGSVGAVQPKLLIAGPTELNGTINSLGVSLDDTGAGSDIGYGEPDRELEPRDIEIFTGGAVLFSKEFIDSTGGFDERFMLYYEDVDLSLRGRELGWRYRLAPSAVVEHIGGLSTGAQPARTLYLQERNRLWNTARHGTSRGVARAMWLSVRRLRRRPYGVHTRALLVGIAGTPSRIIAQRRAATSHGSSHGSSHRSSHGSA